MFQHLSSPLESCSEHNTSCSLVLNFDYLILIVSNPWTCKASLWEYILDLFMQCRSIVGGKFSNHKYVLNFFLMNKKLPKIEYHMSNMSWTNKMAIEKVYLICRGLCLYASTKIGKYLMHYLEIEYQNSMLKQCLYVCISAQ